MLSVRLKKRLGNGSVATSVDRGGATASTTLFQLDVDFVVPAGVTILFGPSGAGKSSVLRCIAGIVTPDAGSILVGQTALFDSASGVNLPIRKRGVGYVFQDLALFPHLTALGNVEFGIDSLDRDDRRDRALALMQALKIAHTADRKPAQISGGEAQRVALARALAVRPKLLLLDEPLSAIDEATKLGIIADLKGLNRDLELPILYVTHNRDEAVTLGERILIMERGSIVAAGEPLEVFGAPVSKSVARLTGVENLFEAQVLNVFADSGTASVLVSDQNGSCQIDIPGLDRASGQVVTVAVRSGDILLATSPLHNTSARNILPGTIGRIDKTADRILVNVISGVNWVVSVTREAALELDLSEGQSVWIAFKTYSCHILDK
jgi:molybdate transport system ATP-binding protein